MPLPVTYGIFSFFKKLKSQVLYIDIFEHPNFFEVDEEEKIDSVLLQRR